MNVIALHPPAGRRHGIDVAAIDALWARYLDHVDATRAVAAATAQAVSEAVGGRSAAFWDAQFDEEQAWRCLARSVTQQLIARFAKPGVHAQVTDADLIGPTAPPRYDHRQPPEVHVLALAAHWRSRSAGALVDRGEALLGGDGLERLAMKQATRRFTQTFERGVRVDGQYIRHVSVAPRRDRLVISHSVAHAYGRGWVLSDTSIEGISTVTGDMALAMRLRGKGEGAAELLEAGGAALKARLRAAEYRSRQREQVSDDLSIVLFKDSVEYECTEALLEAVQVMIAEARALDD